MPESPEEREESEAERDQVAGSVEEDCQALALRVEPTAWKRMEYEVLGEAAKGTEARMEVVPLSFLWMMREVPSM